ncbi:MAG: hypothetical protein HQK55_06170 [Deltaproteobacteria bacterium]|nr:hypothetical protein [Deltaproteobacteria bacterium]
MDDSIFFNYLKKNGKVCIFVRNQHDNIWQDGKEIYELAREISEDTCNQVRSLEQVYFTSCRTGQGIKELSEAIYHSIGEANQGKWLKSAKAYSIDFLDKKKRECQKYVLYFAGIAATNALNPLPGVDIGIDVAVLVELFIYIRKSYGLTDQRLNSNEHMYHALTPLANKVIKYSTKQGILLLLEKFADKQIVKSVTKYIPFVGQLIAATIGFGITRSAGMSYLEDCHDLAKNYLEEELKFNNGSRIWDGPNKIISIQGVGR